MKNSNNKEQKTQAQFFLFQEKFFYKQICEKFKKKYRDFDFLSEKLPTLDKKTRELVDFYIFLLKSGKLRKQSVFIIKQFMSEGVYTHTDDTVDRLEPSIHYKEGTFIKTYDTLRNAIYKAHPDSRQYKLNKETFKHVADMLMHSGIMKSELHYNAKEQRQYKSYKVSEDYLMAHLILHKMGIFKKEATAKEIIHSLQKIYYMANNARTQKQYAKKFLATTFCTHHLSSLLITNFAGITHEKGDFKHQKISFCKHLKHLLMNNLSTNPPPKTARIPPPENRPYISNINIYTDKSNSRARGVSFSGMEGNELESSLSEYHSRLLHQTHAWLVANPDNIRLVNSWFGMIDKRLAYAKKTKTKIHNRESFIQGALRDEMSRPWNAPHRRAVSC